MIEIRELITVKKIVIFLMLIFGMNVMALLVPCAEGDTKCVIQGFKVNGEIINEEGSQDIKYIVHFINNFAESGSIEIIGHTDSIGTKRHNLKLSIIRAENAAKMLREFGLNEKFIISKITGEGENFPIDTNTTVNGRYNNRRVEIFIKNIKFKELAE